MKRVSLKDIASEVGVAPSTVSFVLNGKAKEMRISESLAEKITKVAKRAGYHPNRVAVSLRTGTSKIIGLIVEDISNNFFATLAKIIEQEADLLGYKVVFCSTENDTKKGGELIRILYQQQVDGYLVTPTAGMQEDIRQLISDHKPVVLMDRYFPGLEVPYVLADNFGGMAEGMNHLIDKGYSKIGFVTVDLDLIQMREREAGYIESLKAKNIEVNPELLLRLNYSVTQQEAVIEICNFLQNHPQMDAIFFATNYLGIAGLESIRARGLNIPGDIAVICFDDHDIFRLYTPGITSIRQPVQEIAKNATRMLMEQLSKDTKTLQKNNSRPAAKMVIREST